MFPPKKNPAVPSVPATPAQSNERALARQKAQAVALRKPRKAPAMEPVEPGPV